ncbi:small conductance mechanosensitive channel [Krasilnikovia cinnamomea]|uniref:Small conductance mechanosensitive channel n=1 Tax=Krasilnikovia cinnamomea TaxID=349313 RepID=A0A4Q7ZQ43_9ACTN|nr:small conductance mechanosensitive channel [Krasilnikovia cinnamomea]
MLLAVAPLTDLTAWVGSSGLEIVLFISGAVLLARTTRWTSQRATRRIANRSPSGGVDPIRSERDKHLHVLANGIRWAVVVVIYCVTAILVLQRLNVPITGLIAPAVVAGMALGMGAQRLVQDILAGFFIIVERQYGFGDIVRISALGSETGVGGTVEEVTLRVTRLRTADGEVVIVPNGQIVQVTNASRDWARAVVDVPVPSTADIRKVRAVLEQVGLDVYLDEQLRPLLLDPPSALGVETLEVDTLRVRMVARTLPGKQFLVGRELRSRVAASLQTEGILVPAGLGTADPITTP